MALEKEVEMEQKLAETRKEREKQLFEKLENQFAKREDLSKKEIKEMLKALESELKVKWESILVEARQSALERSNGNWWIGYFPYYQSVYCIKKTPQSVYV